MPNESKNIAERRVRVILRHFESVIQENKVYINAGIKASELMKHIFNGDAKKVKECLSTLSSLDAVSSKNCILLTRIDGKEEYFSQRNKKMICKRAWKNISPLEAAALTGDNYLVRELLTEILIQGPAELRIEAANQLNGILHRFEMGDNGYLAPYKALIKAYRNYVEQTPGLALAHNWKKIAELWGAIGEKQKLLPTYGLQEFCDFKVLDPLPSFNLEPKRTPIILDAKPLNLDFIGKGRERAIFKGALPFAYVLDGNWPGNTNLWLKCLSSELKAIEHLVDTRTKELNDIVKSLFNSSTLTKSKEPSVPGDVTMPREFPRFIEY